MQADSLPLSHQEGPSFGEWATLRCSVQASHCGGLSCGAQALRLVDYKKSKSRNGRGPFTNTPSDLPATFLLPVPVTLCSVGLESLVPERGMLPPGDTMIH